MGKRCIVGGCSQTPATGVSLYRLPKAVKIRQLWIRQLRTTRADLTPQYFTSGNPASMVVCSNHFQKEDFLPDFFLKEKLGLQGSKKLKPEAVPSVFAHRETLTLTHPQASSTPKAFDKREHQRVLDEIFNEADDSAVKIDNDKEAQLPQKPSMRSVKIQVTPSVNKPKTSHKKTQTNFPKLYRSIGVQVTDLQPAVPVEPHDSDSSSIISNSTAEMLEDKSDAVYLPPPSSSSCTNSSLSSQDDKNCSDPYNQLTERKFIVFLSSLLALFRICRSCKGPAQGQVCQELGSYISIRQECFICSESFLWRSQPFIRDTPAGNLAISSAILCSGATPTKFLRTLQHINIQTIGLSTFFRHQQQLLTPAIFTVYTSQQQKVLADIRSKGEDLIAIADGRCDSPGHSAKFLNYTVMDAKSGKIVDTELIQSNEVQSSNHMEKEGLLRAVETLQGQDIRIGTIITDRHVQIKVWIRENLPETVHFYDIWHVAKSICKKMEAIAKLKGCEDLRPWIRSISNHLYWSAASEEPGRGDAILAKWQSVVNHVQNVHTNHGPHFPSCLHGPVEEDGVRYKWLTPGSKTAVKLEELVFKKHLENDIKKLSPVFQTSALESFHSVINHFCPKQFGFSYLGMKCRIFVAVLHFNENAGRPQATTRAGVKRYNIVFPKYKKGEHIVTEIKEECTYEYVSLVLQEVAKLALQQKEFTAFQVPPPLCSSFTRPDKDVAVASHLSRFNRSQQ